MRKPELMRDPVFAQILFLIESMIHDADVEAAADGAQLTDSLIKSSISRAKILAKGGRPKTAPQTERERFILDLAEKIDGLRTCVRESEDPDAGSDETVPVRTAIWLEILKSVEESIKLRAVPGERYYLDFLRDFIAEARASETEKKPQENAGKRKGLLARIFK